MKKLSFLMLAVAGMLFAACSSDKDVANDVPNPEFNGKSEGFFKISINLPTAPNVSMRAWSESTNLNDGLPTEYAVEKVLLLIFDGASESAATMKQCIDLGTWDKGLHTADDPNPNQITTRKDDYVAQLKAAPTNNLYALAVVNPNGIITAGTADNKLVVKGDELTEPTLATIKTKLAASANVTTNDFVKVSSPNKYFFMTNAVLSNTIGGNTKPATSIALQTLAPVDKSFIYDTEAKAVAGQPATDIYVERAVAKVTLDATTDADYLKTTALTASTGLTLSATLSGWSLDNTNKSSYIIRQVPSTFSWNLKTNSTAVTSDPYRFVGGNPVDPAVALYRTYWAEDPNYSTAWASGTFSNVEASAITNTAVGDGNPLYCFENTFDVAHQTFQNTTRAILAVKLTSGTDNFYVIGADRKTLYTEADVKNKIKDYIMSQLSFVDWFNDPDAAKGGKGTLTGDALTVTFDKPTAAGKLQVESFTVPATNTDGGADITVSGSSTNVEGHDLSGVITTLNTQLNNVERFVGGIAYYPIRIKHFGDHLTPWNNGEYTTDEPKESGINDIYPTTPGQDANYLGRYGMVRNNWYDLVIGEILKIGGSTIPELTAHPDDELEDIYIKARINILSWAKRTQNWDLK